MRKIIDYLIGTFVFFSSVFYIPGQNFHDSQKVLFQIVAMLFFAMYLSFKPVRQVRNVWISSYLIYAIIIFISLKAVQGISIVSLINIFLMVALYYTFVNHLKNVDVIYKAIQGIIIVNIIFLVFQILKIDPLILDDMRRKNTHLVGLFGHPMNMGIFCSIVLPYVFSKSKFWAGLVFICLIASQSYISIILGIVGLLVYLFFIHRKAFKVVLIASLVVSVLSGCYIFATQNKVENRFIIEKVTHRYKINMPLLKAALSNPYHGYGLGTFKHVTAQIYSPEIVNKIGWIDVPWNDPIGCMLEMGVCVLFIFFGLFKQTFVRFSHMTKSKDNVAIFACLSTIPIGIMFHSYMNYINVGVICVALFSMFEIKLREDRNVY